MAASILLRFGGEDFVDVAAPVENPHNLGDVGSYSIEDDMRTAQHRAKSSPDFVSLAASKRIFLQHSGGVADSADDGIGDFPPGALGSRSKCLQDRLQPLATRQWIA